MSDAAVLDRLDSIERVMFALPVPDYVGVSFIAAKLGVSEPYLRKRPYLQPAYGVSEVPGRMLWSLKTVRAWLDVSPAEHERVWDALPVQTKRAIDSKRGVR
jgi:hypothetical protein